MARKTLGEMVFARIYPLYVQKAGRKNRSQDEVDQVIFWLTGYDAAGLQGQIAAESDLRTFFDQAPALHPNRDRITGLICGIRVEDIADPLERNIRALDKLIDELAKGRPLAKILRA